MFDNPVFVVILLVIVAALGAAAGFFAGRAKGQDMARGAKESDLNKAKAQIEADKQDISNLNAAVAQYRTQAEGFSQQLTYLKSQLAQAQRAEEMRVERERQRAAEEATVVKPKANGNCRSKARCSPHWLRCRRTSTPCRRRSRKSKRAASMRWERSANSSKVLANSRRDWIARRAPYHRHCATTRWRGAWGEAQLRNIVESAGLLEHVDFDTQVVVTDADGHTQRPDMIIHMPGGKTIPIDAKAPYADYQRACEIPDTASPEELARKNELLHSHAKAVRDHVKTLGDKAYWNAFSDAPDFVIAFIPNESLLQAALETDPTLMDDAFAQKVALTSPITLWAVLKSVAYAWQQQSLTDDAKMLFDLSRELYERFAVLGERATKLGSAITKTVGAYNSFAASLESRVLVTARKLQRVDQSKVIGTVDMIAPEKGDIRELSAPETNAE